MEIRGAIFYVGDFCFGTFNRKEAEGELAFESGISGMSGVSGLSGRWARQIGKRPFYMKGGIPYFELEGKLKD